MGTDRLSYMGHDGLHVASYDKGPATWGQLGLTATWGQVAPDPWGQLGSATWGQLGSTEWGPTRALPNRPAVLWSGRAGL
jgi:hypothetical protein